VAGDPHHRRQLTNSPILLDSISRTADPDQALNRGNGCLGSCALLLSLRPAQFAAHAHSLRFSATATLAFAIFAIPCWLWLSERRSCETPARKKLERATQTWLI
jgi:hypothetical protein